MGRVTVFADESGDFNFSRHPKASKYFILTTVTVRDHQSCSGVLSELRHDLAWEGVEHQGCFHASHDPKPVRRRVFKALEPLDFRVDSIIFQKSKATPLLQDDTRLYQTAWFYLMKHVTPQICSHTDKVLVVAASYAPARKRTAFHGAVQRVMSQIDGFAKTACWKCEIDACLQIADYCGWAVQRKWEMGDSTAYDLIASKISSEFDIWQLGQTTYY